MNQIVLGLSDGVDSCVAAALLKLAGFSVLGVYLETAGESEKQAARQSAREAGIAFESVDIHGELEAHVCRPFVDEYLRGRTPSPCPGCNRDVKLKILSDIADRAGVDKIATGHYVRSDGERLYMGKSECDQSYMLARLVPSQVKRLLLPLGEYSKTEVRSMAREMGFSCAARPDSRENCFIRGMDYAAYIEQKRPGALPGCGDVLFRGQRVGEHAGIYHFTVGQRWHTDFDGRRAYVQRIDAENNRVHLCLWEELFTSFVRLEALSFIAGRAPDGEFDASIRVRHTRWETPACRVRLTDGGCEVSTLEPLRAPAPGQTAALYQGDMLLGGGVVSGSGLDG